MADWHGERQKTKGGKTYKLDFTERRAGGLGRGVLAKVWIESTRWDERRQWLYMSEGDVPSSYHSGTNVNKFYNNLCDKITSEYNPDNYGAEASRWGFAESVESDGITFV